MPYIGHAPTNSGNFYILDDFNGLGQDGSSSTYDQNANGTIVNFKLMVAGVAITPNVDNLIVTIDGVLQHPTDAYTISGSILTFTGAPASGVDFHVVIMGQSSTVGEGSIGADELQVSGDGTNNQLLKSDGDGTMSWINQNTVTASTAATLATARAINGVNFDGSAAITVTADANTLSNTTLKSTVVSSSLQSVGTLATAHIQGAQAYASSATNLATTVSKKALRVQGSSNASVSLWMGALANDAQQYIQACNDAGNGADDIVLNPFGGKVGIGIGNASPTALFEVKTDNENVARFDGLQGNIDFRYGSDIEFDRAGQVYITANNGSGELNFRTGGQNIAMHIDSSQRVGIGTTSPSYKLHVADDTANDYAAYIINDNADGSGLRLRCDDSDGDEYLFYAENSTTARFAIKSDGKTGIGTASPQTTLHVGTGNEAPDIDAVALISNAGTTNLAIRNSTNNVELLNYVDSSQGIIGTATNHPLRIRTNNSDRITITSNGQVGIHTTSPNVGAFNDERGVLTISSTDNSGANNYAVLELQGHSINTSGVNGLVMFLDHTVEEARIQSNSVGSSQGDLRFYTNAGSGIVERVRVTHDGYFGIGKTTDGLSANGGFWHLSGENSYNEFVRTTTSDSSANLYISRANNGFPLWFGFIGASPMSVGSVSITNSATSFNTTSDYRIKENEIELPNALSRVNNLKPYRFNFISDADNTVDGFFAHEVAEVVPEAVTGEKDAVDDDGEIEPQQLDQSKLVPLLVKAVQELSAKVEALENA